MNQAQEQKLQGLQQLKSDYETIFNLPAGKRVLKDILLSGKCEVSSFVAGDQAYTAFNEGKRALALHIKQMSTQETSKKTKTRGTK